MTWDDLALTEAHKDYLSAHAILPEAATSVTEILTEDEVPDEFKRWASELVPSLVYNYVHGENREVQIHPDVTPVINGEPRKYFFRSGSDPILNQCRDDGEGPIVLCEGSKQQLAALSYAPEDYAVYGFPGCWSGVQDDLSFVMGREVYLIFDGDVKTNSNVWTAAGRMKDVCELNGAQTVSFVSIPGKDGLDDFLARTGSHGQRRIIMKNLLSKAAGDIGKRPKAARKYFNPGLQVETLAKDIFEAQPTALTVSKSVALYRDGVYNIDGMSFSAEVAKLLREDFRRMHVHDTEAFTAGILLRTGRLIPEHLSEPMLNCANGMLDLRTMELKPHDPGYLSGVQIAIEWDPEAECPTYDSWIAGVAGDQVDDLEECTATMLDQSRTPQKSVLMFGPSRSGKSTFIRLMEAVVGRKNYESVTLHQILEDKYAAAMVFGKMLISSADIKSAHLQDISTFKMLTGGDSITANVKFKNPFTFKNTALFAFSANEVPTVGESSRAYQERIKPFKFGNSFAGHEDPSIEERMMRELPGILRRWVAAWNRMRARGGYLATGQVVRREFHTASDRVAQWLDECCVLVAHDASGGKVVQGCYLPRASSASKTDLFRAFTQWASDEQRKAMGRNTFTARLTSMDGVFECRLEDEKQRGSRVLNIIVKPRQKWGEAEPQAELLPPQIGSGPEVTLPRATSASEEGNAVTSGNSETHRDGEDHSRQTEALEAVKNTLSHIQKVVKDQVGIGMEDHDEKYVLYKGAILTASFATTASRLIFDLETADAAKLWSYGPGYVRLVGSRVGDGPSRTGMSPRELIDAINVASSVEGHNILGFDLVALAREFPGTLDLPQLAAKCVDTLLLARLDDPPASRKGRPPTFYDLDTVGERVLGIGKQGDIRGIAKKHGGYDKIPVDDQEYNNYCVGDVDVSAGVADHYLPMNDYARREHLVAGIAAQIRLNGFKVDTELLPKRIEGEEYKRSRALHELMDNHGVTPVGKDGKPSKGLGSDAGKHSLLRAFQAAGVKSWPWRTKEGASSTGKDAMAGVRETYRGNETVQHIADLADEVNGARVVYATVEKHRVRDKVHPNISMGQSSGRWSTTDPGLTVFGKRDGRVRERDIFLPDFDDHVLVALDLSQIEARAVAALSGDEAYLDLFLPGKDSHSIIAEMVFGSPEKRDTGKILHHAYNYGAHVEMLMTIAGCDYETAELFFNSMGDLFPDLAQWRNDMAEIAANGDLLDNGFGRFMRPDRYRASTTGPALMGQGCGRDLMMEGLLNAPRECLPMMKAVVHDEVILSVPRVDAPDVAQAMKEALSFHWVAPGMTRGVDVVADLPKSYGSNWGACYA